MKYTAFLADDQKKHLEYEVVSNELKVHLTRLLHRVLTNGERADLIVLQNQLINSARNLQGLKIYVLEDAGYGFEPIEYAWHHAEFQLLFRRLNTIELIEFVGDLIRDGWISAETVNTYLEKDGVSFRYSETKPVRVEVLPLEEVEALVQEIEKENGISPHANIRLLITRAEDAIARKDYAQVVHACASVFETLAKDLIQDANIDHEPLGGFFDKYRKESELPKPILDFIHSQYKARNTMPLAGHGSRFEPPKITERIAILLVEMTKAFVKTEYRLLSRPELQSIASQDKTLAKQTPK